MMKRVAFLSAFALVISVVIARSAKAEISQMTVHVDGLTCPFCVFNLEKKLRPLRGVGDVDIELKTGRATMMLAGGRGPTVGEIERAVRNAGFSPRTISLTAIGTLSSEQSYILLSVRHFDDVAPAYRSFYLFQKGQGKEFFDQKTRARLEGLAKEKALVAITGDVHEHAEGLPALSVDKIKVLPDAGEQDEAQVRKRS